MTLRPRIYAVTAAVLLAFDMLWLGVVAPPLYRAELGPLLRPDPDLVASVLFYALYVVGVCEFVLLPLGPGADARRRAARGALFGLIAYATFDLTAKAVLNGWTWRITAIDMAWGALLTALTAAIAGRFGFARARPR